MGDEFEALTINTWPLGMDHLFMFCATFLLAGFVYNTASSSAEWSGHIAVSPQWLFGIVPKSGACSLVLTEILVRMAGSFLKEKCHWKDESWQKKAERTVLSAFVLGLDGSQSMSFWHLSGVTGVRNTLCRSSVVTDKLPAFISH